AVDGAWRRRSGAARVRRRRSAALRGGGAGARWTVAARARLHSRWTGTAHLMKKDSLHPADDGRMQQGFSAFPPVERWDDWVERGRHYSLAATTCFNCEAACGLIAY